MGGMEFRGPRLQLILDVPRVMSRFRKLVHCSAQFIAHLESPEHLADIAGFNE
jgi:hypothetical protein